MGDSLSRAGVPELLHYRPWRGTFRQPAASVWPIARTALVMLFRRRLFWGLYALSLLSFLMFFFGQQMLALAKAQAADPDADLGFLIRGLLPRLRKFLKLDGSGESMRDFFNYQGYMVMVVLALAGSVLVGNDLHHGSLPYYLSKPLSRRHYLLGKALAVAVFINLMTTLPALILFGEYGLLVSWDYFFENADLIRGILAYGLVLTLSLAPLLLATATWLRRTVPLIMAWATLFFFCRLLTSALVDGLHYNRLWRLLDLWNDITLVGSVCLGLDPLRVRPYPQPPWGAAALILLGVSLTCLTYLVLRIRGVEIVH